MTNRCRLLIVLAVLFLGALGAPGCTTYMNIRTLQPAPLNLQPVREIVLLPGSGRDKVVRIATSELAGQARSRGHFAVRQTASGNPDVVYVRIKASHFATSPAVVTRNVDVELEDGSVVTRAEVVPILRGSARLGITVLSGDQKTVVLQRDFVGRSEMDITVPPPPAAEAACANAVAEFLAVITPRIVTSSVKLDRSDDGTLGYVELARAGNIEGAADGLEQYVKSNPNSAAGHYNLAVMLDALGQYELALTHYDRAITLGGKRWYRRGRMSCAQRLADSTRT